MISCHSTLLLDALNTQDHGLALHWTRDTATSKSTFHTAQAPCGAAAVSLPARTQHGMLMRAHATHRTQLLASCSAICRGRQEVKNSMHTKLPGSCGSKRHTRQEHISQGRIGEDSRGQAVSPGAYVTESVTMLHMSAIKYNYKCVLLELAEGCLWVL